MMAHPSALRRRGLLTAIVAWAMIAAAPADAAGSAGCALSTTSLVFGQYVPSRDGPSDFTATLYLSCTASGTDSAAVEGTIGLIGRGGSAGRELADGSQRLRYQLFIDPARTILWGDGSGNTRTKSISVVVGPTTPFRGAFIIYGRILGRQSRAPVGNYTDQITAVVNY